MAWFVEARDPYTGGHLWRVCRLSRLLAGRVGLPEAEVARVAIGGFLHDLGKIGVPDAILRKPGRLTDDEYSVMKTHPSVGLKMLAGHPLLSLVREAVFLHHERPDGRGYPAGLRSDAIPIDARIVGICDAFDAMTSARPYRRGMPISRSLEIIADRLGTQFDRELGTAFLGLVPDGVLDHIAGHSDDGIPLKECPVCGPIVVVRRTQEPGERIYCRNCAMEFELERRGGALEIHPTGKTGLPGDLAADVDLDLIARVIAASIRAVPVQHLVDRYVDQAAASERSAATAQSRSPDHWT